MPRTEQSPFLSLLRYIQYMQFVTKQVSGYNAGNTENCNVECDCVCVYYCRTYYKAVRGGGRRRVDDMCYDRRRAEAWVDESAHHALASDSFTVCVFITAGPITKLFAGPGGGGGEWTTCAMIDDEPRPVWMSPLITH